MYRHIDYNTLRYNTKLTIIYTCLTYPHEITREIFFVFVFYYLTTI